MRRTWRRGLTERRLGAARRVAWALVALLFLLAGAAELTETAHAAHGTGCPLHANPMVPGWTAALLCPPAGGPLVVPESEGSPSQSGPSVFIPPRA